KREEARQVAARLDELSARYERLSDRANEARAELAEVQERIGQAQDRLDATVAERDQRRTELQSYAVGAYLGGPDNSALSVAVESDDEREMPVRLGYLDTVTGNRAQLIDQLQATEQDVEDRVVDLEENRAAAEELVTQIDADAAEAQQAIEEQQQVQSQIDAELERLIEEQRAAEAAARQAALDAAAAQAAAQTPAADPTSGDTGGGTGGTTPTSGTTPTPAPPAAGASGAVAAAMSMQGVPYRWGGADPSGFDCSGLMMWAWARAGRSLPHSSAAQYSSTRRVAASDLQPGDLVFYGSPIHHVGMYIGGGMIVHAPHSGDVVRTASLGYVGSPIGYGRP
ncbi:MAG: C40 family peptidase, partial [Acidimicrobiales bacterium]|nr:C40 family peptidase [Acidimicrobiales bacterium]